MALVRGAAKGVLEEANGPGTRKGHDELLRETACPL